jgi:hypothetical protein
MKKKFSIIAVLMVVIFNSIAQPNGGFENWNTTFNYQEPTGWQTLNFLTLTSPPNPMSASKVSGIDAHSGNFALKIKTIYINNNPVPQAFDDSMGLVFTGKITISPPTYRYGFPCTQRPEKLSFWAKYLPVGNDLGDARVYLRKWNGSTYDTIAKGDLPIPATSVYTFYELSLIYYSNNFPDSAIVGFGSSKSKSMARPNSTIFVDDVAFTGSVAVNELHSDSKKVKVFPNPATNNITIQADIEEAENVQIADISGKVIGVYKINNSNVIINTASFASGNYFYKIINNKNSTLANGKFNVIK